MPHIVLDTRIKAPRATCFDAARDIGLHCRTCASTRERAVGGRTRGLIYLGESVTFEATHLGVRQRLTSRIVAFEAPNFFVDQMTRGAFQSLRHTHEFFDDADGATRMRDTLEWVSPLGFFGKIADALFLKSHLRRFLRRRNAALKKHLENEARVLARSRVKKSGARFASTRGVALIYIAKDDVLWPSN